MFVLQSKSQTKSASPVKNQYIDIKRILTKRRKNLIHAYAAAGTINWSKLFNPSGRKAAVKHRHNKWLNYTDCLSTISENKTVIYPNTKAQMLTQSTI